MKRLEPTYSNGIDLQRLRSPGIAPRGGKTFSAAVMAICTAICHGSCTWSVKFPKFKDHALRQAASALGFSIHEHGGSFFLEGTEGFSHSEAPRIRLAESRKKAEPGWVVEEGKEPELKQ